MAFARVDDENAARAKRRKHVATRLDSHLEPRHVVAERGAEPAGFEKVALHVDDDEGGMGEVDMGRRRFGFDFDRRHAASPLAVARGRLKYRAIIVSCAFRKNRATRKAATMAGGVIRAQFLRRTCSFS